MNTTVVFVAPARVTLTTALPPVSATVNAFVVKPTKLSLSTRLSTALVIPATAPPVIPLNRRFTVRVAFVTTSSTNGTTNVREVLSSFAHVSVPLVLR